MPGPRDGLADVDDEAVLEVVVLDVDRGAVLAEHVEELVDHGRGVEGRGQVGHEVGGVDVDAHVARVGALDDALDPLRPSPAWTWRASRARCPTPSGTATSRTSSMERTRRSSDAWLWFSGCGHQSPARVVARGPDAGARHAQAGRQARDVTRALHAAPAHLLVRR